MIPGRWALALLGAAALALIVARALTGAYVEAAWYSSLGASALWTLRWRSALLLTGSTAVLGTAYAFAHLYAARRSVVSLVLPRRVGNLDIGEEIPRGRLTAGVAVLAVVLGVALAISSQRWPTLALARNGLRFGESDPYLEYDLGFFVYWLPFETTVYTWALITVVTVAVVVIVLYALTPSLRWERRTLHVSTYVRRHLALLGAVFLGMLAWSYRLEAFGMFMEGTGPGNLFTATDQLRAFWLAPVLVYGTAAVAVVVAWGGWSGQRGVLVGALTGGLVATLVVRFVVPLAVEQLSRTTTEAERNRGPLRNRYAYTARAYGLDEIHRTEGEESGQPARGSPGPRWAADVARGTALWDPAALRSAVAADRGDGTIPDALGWRMTSTGLTAYVVVRPPPGDSASGRWRVVRVLAPAADARGEPVWLGASGTVTPGEDSPVIPPVVFEGAGRYAIVADPGDALPAAALNRSWSRVAHAWYLQNVRLLRGPPPLANPKLVLRRTVRERVGSLVPFFTQGTEVVPLVSGDTLYWVLELYSAAETYPLSTRLRMGDARIGYLHHSATALVNSATGQVVLAVDAALDPIARSWVTHLPSLFTPRSALPRELLAALPPPVDGARAQAATFDPFRPLQGIEEAIPSDAAADTGMAPVDPTFVGLPDVDRAGSGGIEWVHPLLDAFGQVRGVLMVVGGARPAASWLELPSPWPMWTAIGSQLRDAPSAGTAAVARSEIHGAIRTVPIGADAIFAQTVYDWPPSGPPVAIGAAVTDGDSVSVGPTIAAALGVRGGATPGNSSTPQAFRARVSELYDRMEAALRRGDFAGFGSALSALGELLGRTGR